MDSESKKIINKIVMSKYVSDKLTSCFRQWRAENTHCRFTHAYKVWFELEFNTDSDIFNDYPEFKHYLNNWFKTTFDYKTFVAKDDPKLDFFLHLNDEGIIDLTQLDHVGCERFSEFVLDEVNKIINKFGFNFICTQVETWEHEKNSGVAYI